MSEILSLFPPYAYVVFVIIILLMIALNFWARDDEGNNRQTSGQSRQPFTNQSNGMIPRGVPMKGWFGVVPDGYVGVPLLFGRGTRFFGRGTIRDSDGKLIKLSVRKLKDKPLHELTQAEFKLLFREPADGVYVRMPFTKVAPVRVQEEPVLIKDPEDRSQSRTPIARLTDSDKQTFYVGYNLFWRVSPDYPGLAFKRQMDIANVGSDAALLSRVRQTVASRGEEVVALLDKRDPDEIGDNIDQMFENELEPLLKTVLTKYGVELTELSKASLYWSDKGEDNMMQPARARRDVEANVIVGRGRGATRNANRPIVMDEVVPGWRELYELGDASDEEIERVALEHYATLSPSQQAEIRAELKAAYFQESMKQLGSD